LARAAPIGSGLAVLDDYPTVNNFATCADRTARAVVDSRRYTRIRTIGVDFSTSSWYIRRSVRNNCALIVVARE
jgi:hypothetical protein